MRESTGRIHFLTRYFSAIRERIGVTEIGLKSLSSIGRGIFGIGVTIDLDQDSGIVPLLKEHRSIWATGPASSYEHMRNNQDGKGSDPGEVGRTLRSNGSTSKSKIKSDECLLCNESSVTSRNDRASLTSCEASNDILAKNELTRSRSLRSGELEVHLSLVLLRLTAFHSSLAVALLRLLNRRRCAREMSSLIR